MKDRRRCNALLAAQPIMVARLFAAANLTGDELNEAGVILDAITASDFQRAKSLSDKFARPEFGTAATYFRRKQFVSLLTKVPFAGSTQARKRKAQTDFWSAEQRCRRVNRRLVHFDRNWSRVSDTTRVVITRAKQWIRRVLGPLDESKLARIISLARPGSGVSVGTRNRFRVGLPFKLGDTDLAVTQRALPYARMMVESSQHWMRLHAVPNWETMTFTLPYEIVVGNRFTYVPKDARTFRTIAIEPSLNVMLQLGVHSYLAEKLDRFGTGISDQGRNQHLAFLGSRTPFGSGSYATIDLSQASDTVSTELVRMLLPSDWFGFLDDIRCHSGTIDGTTHTFQKFSSMGNGFTFALETLIFWALAKACHSFAGYDDVNPSAYGDDVVVIDGAAAILLEVFRFCGFVVNTDKSFVVGPFRESCGADWHNGWRVTPQYIRRKVFRCTDVYNLLNRADPCFEWGPVRDYLLDKHREKEPVLYGLENEDTSSCLFIASEDYLRGSGLMRYVHDLQTWVFKGWAFRPTSEKVPVLHAYCAALFGAQEVVDARYSLKGRGTFRLRELSRGVTRDVPRFFT